jgi:tungstate transport system substrate-binding protein
MTISFSGLLRFARNDEGEKAVVASRRRSNPGDGARRLLLTLVALVAALMTSPSVRAEQPFITLASTTSTQQSGLFAHLLPAFTAKTGIAVHVVAVGTGQALKIGERGDADVLLVHDKPSELKFVAAGWGVDRHDVMYNDFIIAGAKRDPAGIGGGKDAVAAFRKIAQAKAPFVSRGDDSGTDREEKRLWHDAGIDIKQVGDGWYREVGQGMGPTLNMAAALDAYTLSDRGTWLSFGNRRDLALLVAGDQRLFNQYGVMLVNPARHPTVKAPLGKAFIDWLISPAGQQTIAAYKIAGEQLFFPDARE